MPKLGIINLVLIFLTLLFVSFQAKSDILIQPQAGLSSSDLNTIIQAHGGHRVKSLPQINVHVVRLPANANEAAVAKTLSNNPRIKFAEVDERVQLTGSTNDPCSSYQWQNSIINAPLAWASSIGTGVIIAIIDSGVQSNHPDLAAHLVPGWNVYNNNSNSEDIEGHGTAVAATAAAIGNNSIGGAGVAYNASIMPVRAVDDSGGSTFSLVASAITWAADHGAQVANISFSNLYKSSTVISAAQYLRNKGGTTVVSANNNAINENSSGTTSMIVVSATNKYDQFATTFSCSGCGGSSYGNMVDVSAPGDAVQIDLWQSGTACNTAGWGTSFSTPIVAGVVALMKSVNPKLTPDQVDSLLFSTAKDLGSAGYDIYYGYGRVDAGAAVAAAKNAITTTDTTAPSVAISSPTAGAIVSGIVSVNVNASDNVGVSQVNLYVNGALLATDATSPYSFSWDTRSLANGSYSLVAKAYDAAGNIGTSTTIGVTVSNATDTIAPTVAITSPANGSTVSGNVTIRVAASDNVAVTKLQLYIDGVLKSTASSGSLSFSWNTRKVAKGLHTIKAVAFDAAGNTSSTSIQVTR